MCRTPEVAAVDYAIASPLEVSGGWWSVVGRRIAIHHPPSTIHHPPSTNFNNVKYSRHPAWGMILVAQITIWFDCTH